MTEVAELWREGTIIKDDGDFYAVKLEFKIDRTEADKRRHQILLFRKDGTPYFMGRTFELGEEIYVQTARVLGIPTVVNAKKRYED